MRLKDYLIATLSVPLSDSTLTKELNDKSTQWKVKRLKEWLININTINPRFSIIKNRIISDNNSLVLSIKHHSPYSVGFLFFEEPQLRDEKYDVNDLFEVFRNKHNLDIIVILLCGDTEDVFLKNKVESIFYSIFQVQEHQFLIFEPEWVTAAIIENLKPFFFQLDASNDFEDTPYFEKNRNNEENKLTIRRVEDRLQFLIDSLGSDSVLSYSKTARPFKGTTMLCTTFLPAVTYSLNAVERFYKLFGVTDAVRKSVLASIKEDNKKWKSDIKKYKRYDIIDRSTLEEYLFAPEYYQMLLTKDELNEQINNLVDLLKYENYVLCLTPEAVDIAFEVQEPVVRIRTDRRNKAKPRVGRISRIEVNDSNICEIFEREFWNKFRLTEDRFKDKSFIIKWITESKNKLNNNLTILSEENQYDVFLSYNSKDKNEVRVIANELKQKGIKPWFDDWDMKPGIPWIKTLEFQIERIKSCAVFVGENGLGPWEDIEQMSFIVQFIKRGCPVIPVILKGSNNERPVLPPLLSIFNMIDMRTIEPNPLDRLIVGIRG